MKAPGKLDRLLRQNRFGYAKPYYLRFNSAKRLGEAWLFGKSASGITVQAMVFYPVDGSGTCISPPEVEHIFPDGRAAISPNSTEGAWSSQALSEFSSVLPTRCAEVFSRLGDPDLMIPVFEFLMGERGHEGLWSREFSDLAHSRQIRKVTPNRLTGKAAYLALAGHFDKARELIGRIPQKMLTPADQKILCDSESGEVRVPSEFLDYLKSIGARTQEEAEG